MMKVQSTSTYRNRQISTNITVVSGVPSKFRAAFFVQRAIVDAPGSFYLGKTKYVWYGVLQNILIFFLKAENYLLHYEQQVHAKGTLDDIPSGHFIYATTV